MARRSPWASQKKTEQSALAAKYSGGLLSEKGMRALEAKEKGVENIQPALRAQIIRASAGKLGAEIASLIHENPHVLGERSPTRTPSAANIRKFLRRDPESLDPEMQATLARMVVGHTLKKEASEIPERLKKRIREYFKNRKIPIVETDLDIALLMYLRLPGNNLRQLAKRVDIRKIEGIYMENRQMSRAAEHENARQVNSWLDKICRGIKFTPAQRKNIKRWLVKELGPLEERRVGITREFGIQDFLQWKRKLDEIDRQFIESARKNFSAQFKPPQKEGGRQPATGQQGPTKLGTREDRIARYAPHEKSASERESEMRETEKYSRQAGLPFDATKYCLSQIAKESPASAEYLGGLLSRGIIQRNALTSLFTSGSLTQRVFIRVAKNTDFQQRFGQKELNTLARGLAFIGPKGRPISRAKLAFQSPAGSRIFEFLETHGMLETHHAGGNVAYLARNIPQY